MKTQPEQKPLFPEIPMPGRSAEIPALPPIGTPPFPDPAPRVNDLYPEGSAYDQFARTGSISDYLLYKNQSAREGGFPLDHQNPGHRPGTDGAQFPGQKTDPAHF